MRLGHPVRRGDAVAALDGGNGCRFVVLHALGVDRVIVFADGVIQRTR